VALALLVTAAEVQAKAGGVDFTGKDVAWWSMLFEQVIAHTADTADQNTPLETWFGKTPVGLARAKQAQLAAAAHVASMADDTPAGTGSQASVSIGRISVGNTMAKNNAPYDDYWNMTQYGTEYLTLRNSACTWMF